MTGRKLTSLLALLILTVLPVLADEGNKMFEVLNSSNGLADNSAQTLTCTKTGRIIITTAGNVNFYDGTAFSNIECSSDCIYPLRDYEGPTRVFFDRRHHLWIKNHRQLTCVDLMTETFNNHVEKVFNSLGVKGTVDNLFVDKAGCLWLVCGKSLSMAEGKVSVRLRQNATLQELDEHEGTLLLFYSDGEVVGCDVNTGKTLYSVKAPDETMPSVYNSSSCLMFLDGAYLQIRNGEKGAVLMRFDLTTHSWATLLKTPYRQNQMAMHDNLLYIASDNGYLTYDFSTEKVCHYNELKLRNGRRLQMTPIVNSLTFDKQGGMWLGTSRRGILYARPHEPPFVLLDSDTPEAQQYIRMMDHTGTTIIPEFRGMSANCMLIDSRRWTWFGTMTGLYLYKSPKSSPVIISKKNGLLNNVIHTVTEDDQNNIWVSTSYGVSVVNMDHDEIGFVNSYNYRDNVPNEMFLNGRSMKLDDGRIVLQSLDHVLVFQPLNFTTNTPKNTELYPKLIKMLVNGKQVETGDSIDGKVILPQAITRTKTIELTSEQNTVSLTFTGLNYFRPIQTYYRVRVKGWKSDEWKVYSYYNSDGKVDGRGMLHLPLIGLRPGSYSVEIQVSMYPDVWNTVPYEWIINVNEPWWRTTGMFLLLGTAILIMIGLNFVSFYRNTHLRIQRNNQEGEVVHRIKNFVERCDEFDSEILAPRTEEIYNGGVDTRIDLSDDFVALMLKLIPYIHEQKTREITMRNLCDVAGIDISDMYTIVSANLYKSPRMLARIFRLQKACEMLTNTDVSLESIASECGFVTPNFFIANFYHQYKMTPKEFREKNGVPAT